MKLQIVKAVDWILSLIPFNGDKTKLGALLSLVFELQAEFPEFDYLQFLDARLAAFGFGLFWIGVIHKVVKHYVSTWENDYTGKGYKRYLKTYA